MIFICFICFIIECNYITLVIVIIVIIYCIWIFLLDKFQLIFLTVIIQSIFLSFIIQCTFMHIYDCCNSIYISPCIHQNKVWHKQIVPFEWSEYLKTLMKLWISNFCQCITIHNITCKHIFECNIFFIINKI